MVGGFAALPCVPVPAWGAAGGPWHPGPVGVREGTRGHPACATTGTCGRQVAAGAWGEPRPFPVGGQAWCQVSPRRSLVEDGNVFSAAAGAGGAGGSAACEQPFAFLGHVTAGCAGCQPGPPVTRGGGPGVPESPAGGSVRSTRGAGGAGPALSCGTGIVPSGWGQICHSLEAEGGRGEAPGSHGEERGGAAVVTVTVTATWLPPAGRVCSPLPAGLLGGGTVAVWQCQPRCARAQMLAAAPLPGLPSRLSSLVTGPCFDPRSQDPTNSGCAGEKRDTEPAQRALALRPGAAWQRSSSTAWNMLPALPSSLCSSSTPPRIFGSGIFGLESLPAVLEMAPAVPGSSRWAHGWGTAQPWHRAPAHPTQPGCPQCCHIPSSRASQVGWRLQDGLPVSPCLEEDDAPAPLQPWAAAMPQGLSMGIWTEALQTHFLPRAQPLMGTGLAQGHLANARSSVAPRCSRGPLCPPCAAPVCSFLMSSKSRMEPGPFSSLEHLGGSWWGWGEYGKKNPLGMSTNPAANAETQNPPLELSRTELMEKRDSHPKDVHETPRKRPLQLFLQGPSSRAGLGGGRQHTPFPGRANP